MENSLDILYEDNHIIVVMKPQNIPTQSDVSGDVDLLSMTKQYIKEKYNKPGEAFLGLVHRLDRPTGGVIVFAKTSKGASRLCEQIKDGTFQKTYFAVVNGVPNKLEGNLVNYLKKNEKENKVTVVPMTENGAKKAELEYEVLQTVDNLSLIKINLLTGRTHQIRVQFANQKLPLVGDGKYGKEEKATKNLALWAVELSFKHPTKDETMHFKVYPQSGDVWNKFSLEKFLEVK